MSVYDAKSNEFCTSCTQFYIFQPRENLNCRSQQSRRRGTAYFFARLAVVGLRTIGTFYQKPRFLHKKATNYIVTPSVWNLLFQTLTISSNQVIKLPKYATLDTYCLFFQSCIFWQLNYLVWWNGKEIKYSSWI